MTGRWITLATLAFALTTAAAQTRPQPPATGRPQMSNGAGTPTPDGIRTAAARGNELRKLLADPDPSVRLSAFDQMADSPDISQQELAYEAGFASAESSMRLLAMRRRLMHMANVSIEVIEILSDPKRATRGAPNWDGYPRAISLSVAGVDERAGVMFISDQKNMNAMDLAKQQNTISISGSSIGIATESYSVHCRGAMRLDDSNALVGPLTCSYIIPGTTDMISFKGRIRLQ